MEVQGKIKKINETQTYGASGFRKRTLVTVTNEQYPQMLEIEFVQDKCDILDKYEVDQDVTISINLRGREWINPEGKAIYFNTIQGWRIEKLEAGVKEPLAPLDNLEQSNDAPEDDLPW